MPRAKRSKKDDVTPEVVGPNLSQEIEGIDPLTTGEVTYGEDIKGNSTLGTSEGVPAVETPGYTVADESVQPMVHPNEDADAQDEASEGRLEPGVDGVAQDSAEDESRVDTSEL